MELIITIAGIVLAIFTLPWLKRPVEDAIRAVRDWWITRGRGRSLIPVVESIRKGTRTTTVDDYFICDWQHAVLVDEHGNSKTEVDCLLVNTSGESKSDVVFPVYFENPTGRPHGWAKFGRSKRTVHPYEFDDSKASGVFRIRFPRPLPPGDHVRFQWGFNYLGVYSAGREWWEWYFGRPHSLFRIAFTFAPIWSLSNVQGYICGEEELSLNQPTVTGQAFVWRIHAPKIGRKCRLEFDLAQKNSSSKNA